MMKVQSLSVLLSVIAIYQLVAGVESSESPNNEQAPISSNIELGNGVCYGPIKSHTVYYTKYLIENYFFKCSSWFKLCYKRRYNVQTESKTVYALTKVCCDGYTGFPPNCQRIDSRAAEVATTNGIFTSSVDTSLCSKIPSIVQIQQTSSNNKNVLQIGLENAFMNLLAYHETDLEVDTATSRHCYQPRKIVKMIVIGQTYVLITKTGQDTVTVAFRGTDSIFDWFTNLNAAPMSIYTDEPDIKVHGGFGRATESVYNKVVSTLNEILVSNGNQYVSNIKTLYITGYSLGCSLATITTSRLARDFPSLMSIMNMYVYGCPIVGNQQFNDDLNQLGIAARYSFTLENDPVSTGYTFNAAQAYTRSKFNVKLLKPAVNHDFELKCHRSFFQPSICHEPTEYIESLIKETGNNHCC